MQKGTIDVQSLARAIAASLNAPDHQEILFEDFAKRFIEDYAKGRKKTWKQDERRLRRHLLPAFSGKSLAEIKRADLAAFHSELGKRAPYAANRALEMLAKMFRIAQVWGYYPDEKKLPTNGIESFKESTREVFVRREDMPRIADSIKLIRAKHLQILFWCYLLTALRECELINAKWTDLDVKRWELTIPDTKNGKTHVLPLSAEAMALISQLPRKGTYIFAGPIPDKPLNPSTVFRCWDRVRKRAGLDGVTIHDLRRTVGSWLAQSGCSLPLIGRVLNHSSTRATEIYARFAQENVREALQQHSSDISQFM